MSKSILKKLFGRTIGFGFNQLKPTSGNPTPLSQVIMPGGFEAGGEGRPTIVFPGPDTVAVFDDFHANSDTGSGTDFPSKFRQGYWIKGSSDTGQTVPATGVVGNSVSSLTNGVYRMTSSATSTQDPQAGAQSLNSPPQWKANQGRLRFSARLKIATLLGNNVFVGFTDTGGTELPVYDTGSVTLLTPAADFVGFLKGGGAGAVNTTWRAVAGKANVDQVATTGITPTANVYNTLEIEISQDGAKADFWIDGILKASINTAAVTATVPLGAGVWRSNTEGAADAIDIDWVNVSAARDTGT